jgi:hypothetical protein
VPPSRALCDKREKLVEEHMESENRHEFDVTLATFEHPRYELIGTGDVYDGAAEVASYFEETRRAFPDQRNELIALHHSDDAVIVEANLYGTHLGTSAGCRRPAAGSRSASARCSCSTRIGSCANASTSTPSRSRASSGWPTIRSVSRADSQRCSTTR